MIINRYPSALTTYAVVTSAAPSKSGFGRYSYVSLVELSAPDARPFAVTAHDKAIAQIISRSIRLSEGRTENCAAGRHRAAMAELARDFVAADKRSDAARRAAATRRERAEVACQLHAESLADALGCVS